MRKGFAPLVLVIIVLVVATIGAVAYTQLKPKFTSQPEVSQSAPTTAVQPSPTPDASREPNGSAETANWKTYTNTDFNFSINYPSWAHVSSNTFTSNIYGFTIESDYLDPNSKDFEKEAGLRTHGKGFMVRVIIQKAVGTFEDFLQKNYMSKCKKSAVVIGNKVFTKIDSYGCFADSGPSYYLQENTLVWGIQTSFVYDEQLYGPNFQQEETKGRGTVNKIISTFKFLD